MIGKLLGGTIGFVLLGPLGAIAGLALGDFFEEQKKGGHYRSHSTLSPNEHELKQQYFFVCTFTILGKLARADGRICEKEINQVEHLMDEVLELAPNERSFAIKLFRASKDDPKSYQVYAEQFFEIFGNRHDILENLLGQMVLLANADNFFHPEEKRLIEEISGIFGFSKEHVRRAFSPFYSEADKVQRAYDILGLSSMSSKEEIKKTYRQLAMEHHPDRVVSRGLSPELIKTATKKFSEIQNAYDLVCKEKGIR